MPRRGADFRLSERQERDRRHPAGKGVRNGRNRCDIGGTGQQESTWPVITIDTLLNCQHQFRHALHFIDHSPFETSHESNRICSSRAQRASVIEGDVGTIGPGELASKRRFSSLTWANDQNHACVGECGLDQWTDFTSDNGLRRY